MPIRSANVPRDETLEQFGGDFGAPDAHRGILAIMKLYTYFRSSAAYRVRIALNLKGVDYELVPVDLRPGAHRQPDYLALNPQGLIPALEDGGAVIGQSLAVIEYLEETHPQPPLLPRSPLDRARVRSLALNVACDMHPLNNLRVLNYLRAPLGAGRKRRWTRGTGTGLPRASAASRKRQSAPAATAGTCSAPR